MNEHRLFTQEQISAEAIAIKLAESAEMKKERESIVRRYREMPEHATPDGRATLEYAVNELSNYAALAAANNDPTRPRLLWTFTPPITWRGRYKAGARWGGDNPDNVFRFAPIDHLSRYEITVRAYAPLPVQYSFMLWDGFMGENSDVRQAPTKPAEGETIFADQPLGGLLDRDLRPDADGSITITIDSLPANGRVNHLQSNERVRLVFIRDTHDEWGAQSPLDMAIKRIDGPPPGNPRTEAEMATNAAFMLRGGSHFLANFITRDLGRKAPNVLSTPWARAGGWGFACNGRFKLADDEALMVHVDAIGAKYLGAVVWNPWAITPGDDYRRTFSLNNRQAEQNKDGSYTYVVAVADPGIRNWLDTGGHHDGALFIRWQSLPDGAPSTNEAVRSVKVVKLADLPELLIPEMTRFTPVMRQAQYGEREHTLLCHYGFPEDQQQS